MRLSWIARTSFALTLLTLAATPALAGPPLVCFPFDIGTARSLPWNADGRNWKGMRADYPVSQLAGDTLGLLTPTMPVIIRMETLRRGALYATTDAEAARALLARLMERAKTNSSDALATFDAGYLVETYKQLAPIAPATAALAAGIDGYAMVNRSRTARGTDPALEFAAAMITADGHRGAWAEHVRVARTGAAADQLLARNLTRLEH
jgi:hypothetical protein